MKTVYILGPMRGHPLYNFPAFDEMASRLRSHGYTVINPADLDREAGFNPYALAPTHDWSRIPSTMKLGDIIDRDVAALRRCTHYVTLDGWERSAGGKAEKCLLDWQGSRRLSTQDFSLWKEPVAPSAPELSQKEAGTRVARALDRAMGDLLPDGEARITDPTTGGQKGQKLARFDLIPGEPLFELAELYGRGAKKYSDDNWRKGYSWKLSFGALNRHLWAWWGGETRDELGNHHLAAVAWHAFTLMWYQLTGRGTDDRPRYPLTPAPVSR